MSGFADDTRVRELAAAFGRDQGDQDGRIADAQRALSAPYTPFESRAQAEGATIPAALDFINVSGLIYRRDGNGADLETQDGGNWTAVSGPLSENLTVRVPSQYPTIKAAFDATFGLIMAPAKSITILIEAGHALTQGLQLDGGDWSNYRISSEDTEVLLSTDWVDGSPLLHLTNCVGPIWDILVDIQGRNASFGEAAAAMSVTDQSSLRISGGCGAKNGAGGSGLFVHHRSSVLAGLEPVFTGFSSGYGIWVTHTSDGYLPRAKATGCNIGAFVSRLSRAYLNGANLSDAVEDGLMVRRSFVTIFADGARATKIDRPGRRGIDAYQGSIVIGDIRTGIPLSILDAGESAVSASSGSFVDLAGAVIDAPVGNGLSAVGSSRISAAGSSITNCGVVAVRAGGSVGGLGQIDVKGSTLSGAVGVEAVEGSTINCVNSTINSTGDAAIRATSNGVVCADGVTIDAAVDGIFASGGRVSARLAYVNAGRDRISIVSGEVSADELNPGSAGRYGLFCQAGRFTGVSADLSGATTTGVVASRGAYVTINKSNWRKGVSDDPSDMQIASGAIVSAGGGTGGANITYNALSGSGILFR